MRFERLANTHRSAVAVAALVGAGIAPHLYIASGMAGLEREERRSVAAADACARGLHMDHRTHGDHCQHAGEGGSSVEAALLVWAL